VVLHEFSFCGCCLDFEGKRGAAVLVEVRTEKQKIESIRGHNSKLINKEQKSR